MRLKIAFQMDPIENIAIEQDSTFRLIEEAQTRGYQLFCYTPDKLSFHEGVLTAQANEITVQRIQAAHFSKQNEKIITLADMDAVWLRQDPPFDMSYITTTYLLDILRKDTLILNDSFWVRNLPEKLSVLNFLDLIPPTLITRDLALIQNFRKKHGSIIIKPLYGNGGAGVFHITPDNNNLNTIHEVFSSMNDEPLIAQKFLPAVSHGDKRVILIDGDPVGAINRVPPKGEARSNMHIGGVPQKTTLNARDKEICETIKPLLRKHGQVFVGIDIIGNYLTEINVTSPTGIQELERFDNINIAGKIWDRVLARLKMRL